MKNIRIKIKTKSKTYPIYIGHKMINKIGNLIKINLPDVKKICIISDKNLPSKFLKNINISLKKYNPLIFILPVNEIMNNMKTARAITMTVFWCTVLGRLLNT